ncbi:MAG TPA: anti-sigma factor, partial [Vicinamibacterales bacterium]|nr:anti-sigma factor [Vicinamibacterales bacterium]
PLSTAVVEPGTSRRWGRGWAILAAVVIAVLAASVLYLRQRLEAGIGMATARAAAAEQDAQAARQLAREQIEQIQRAAETRIASAEQAAVSAQLTANVLAAPDLYRLDLSGTTHAPRAAAQVLWSRSRGIVFSGSRLPPAPAGSAYRLWMLTEQGPVAVGSIQPDQSGRATVGFEAPARLPRPVVGATVTLESAEDSEQPAGPAVLATRTS